MKAMRGRIPVWPFCWRARLGFPWQPASALLPTSRSPMSRQTDLEETIRQGAASPRRATIDGNSAEQQSLRDQIEADRYLSSKTARLSAAAIAATAARA